MKQIPQYFYTSQGPPKPEHIVEVSGFQRARNSIEINLNGKKGNIILLIGTRGIGKSTCIEYLQNFIDTKSKANKSIILDIGIKIPGLLNQPFESRVNIIIEEIAKTLSNNKYKDISSVIKELETIKNPPIFLLIDNLDRLYLRETDTEFVKYFFQNADPIFKALSKKVVIYISCAPEWNKFLDKEDLSYLNYANSINLKQLNNDEIVNLIETRSKNIGLKFKDIIDISILDEIRVASRGNPRVIFQFLEKLLVNMTKKELPITQNRFEDKLGVQLYVGAIEKLRELASESSNITWGINQLWGFFDALQKQGIEYFIGIDKLLQAHSKSQISELEIRKIKNAWSRVAYTEKPKIWKLHKQVRETITYWYKDTKIRKEILLSAFADKPFTLSTSEIEALVDEIREKIIDKDDICSVFYSSLGGYMYITSLEDVEKNRLKLITTGWRTIFKLMLSIIGMEEGAIPRTLLRNIQSREYDVIASEEIHHSISKLYGEFNKINAYRSDIRLILERYIDIKKKPDIVSYWDSDQITSFKHQVLTSYEGLLKDLKPYRLTQTKNRHFIDTMSQIIKKDENSKVEFKSSMVLDSSKKKNKELKIPVMKTIVAFLNYDGGKILVGIDNGGKSIGMDGDLQFVKDNNFDGYELFIRDTIDEYIGNHVQGYIKIKYARYGGNYVTIISVKKSVYPVEFGKIPDNQFICRSGNSNRILKGNQKERYIESHFSKFKSH